MPEFKGYNQGVYEGRQKLQEMAQQRIEFQQKQLDYQTKLEERARENKKLEELAKLQKAQEPLVTGRDYESSLNETADSLYHTGTSILQYDPKAGFDMIKQAQESKYKAHQVKIENLEFSRNQLELSNDVFASVVDEESLQSAKGTLLSLGIQIPEQYQRWSPETKAWMERRALFSEKAIKRLELEQKKIQVQTAVKKNELTETELNLKLKQEDRKELTAQNGIKLAPVSKEILKADRAEINLLNEANPDFKNLSDSAKKVAAKDIRALTLQYMRQSNGEINQVEATQLARKDILNKIKGGEGFFSKSTYDVLGDSKVQETPQERTINGAVYTKVPGGWKLKATTGIDKGRIE